MTSSSDLQHHLDCWRPRFRSLAAWTISIASDSHQVAGATINANTRTATIFEWRGSGPPPHDYILHELLHIAIADATRSPPTQPGCARDDCKCEDEERFIQDLCGLLTRGG